MPHTFFINPEVEIIDEVDGRIQFVALGAMNREQMLRHLSSME